MMEEIQPDVFDVESNVELNSMACPWDEGAFLLVFRSAHASVRQARQVAVAHLPLYRRTGMTRIMGRALMDERPGA